MTATFGFDTDIDSDKSKQSIKGIKVTDLTYTMITSVMMMFTGCPDMNKSVLIHICAGCALFHFGGILLGIIFFRREYFEKKLNYRNL